MGRVIRYGCMVGILLTVFIGATIIWLIISLPGPTYFSLKHMREQAGEQIQDIISYDQQLDLDNSKGTAQLQIQLSLTRDFRYEITMNLANNDVPEQRVREKVIELYKLPLNDPERTMLRAHCPIVVVVPEGQKAKITVEWTERWVAGVINDAQGNRLGTYKIFLGYIEPCEFIKQENLN